MKTMNIASKLIFGFLLTFTSSLSTVTAQNDTMYVMRSGVVVGKYNVNTQVDSVIFYQPIIQANNSFTDARDGNIYKYVTMGTQVWMAENLKYLPGVVGSSTGSETTPHYYVFGYNGTIIADAQATSNYTTYGVLYNWPAAMASSASSSANPSGVQGVCPSGWHLPSDAEWTELENYLADNGYSYDGTTGGGSGKIAKSLAGTSGWTSSSNTGEVGNTDYPEYRNKSGFTALPGGRRHGSFLFDEIGERGSWWSATEHSTGIYAYIRFLAYDLSAVGGHVDDLDIGFSVRCVRD